MLNFGGMHFQHTAFQKSLPSPEVNLTLATKIQNDLRHKVKIEPFLKPIRTVGGADISFNRFSTTAYAVFVVLDFRTFERIDSSYFVGEMNFPYIPGFLSFREVPLLLTAWQKLKIKPDFLMIDGQGIAHPRRLGIAAHFGVLTNSPTLGCAKTKLFGRYEEPSVEARSYSYLYDKKETLGIVYRTKKKTAPIFVSPGHKMDIASSLEILNLMEFRYRIPEPTRQAHIYANELRVKMGPPVEKVSAQNIPAREKSLKEPFDIEHAFTLLREAIKDYPKAAMFELADRGYRTLFQQIVGCLLSIRTYDEVSLKASLRLLGMARSSTEMLKYSVSEINQLIKPVTFHFQKAQRILEIARVAESQFGGQLPADRDIILSLPGVGPKCASLSLGISAGIPAVSVDSHVFRVARRWGLIQADSPEDAAKQLEAALEKNHWIEVNALLVPFGKRICQSAAPRCSTCPLLKMCAQVGVVRYV